MKSGRFKLGAENGKELEERFYLRLKIEDIREGTGGKFRLGTKDGRNR